MARPSRIASRGLSPWSHFRGERAGNWRAFWPVSGDPHVVNSPVSTVTAGRQRRHSWRLRAADQDLVVRQRSLRRIFHGEDFYSISPIAVLKLV